MKKRRRRRRKLTRLRLNVDFEWEKNRNGIWFVDKKIIIIIKTRFSVFSRHRNSRRIPIYEFGPKRRTHCCVCVCIYMLQYAREHIHIHIYILMLSCLRAVRRGPRFVIIGELNRSLIVRCETTGAERIRQRHRSVYMLLLRLVIYAHNIITCQQREDDEWCETFHRLPTTNARGGPSNMQQPNDHS